MTIGLATVADSISKLTVSGVTLKDINEIPAEIRERDVPMIIPRPDGFVSGMRPERVTLGSGANAKWDVRYQLTYRLLHSMLGTGRSAKLFDTYADMVAKATAFVDAVIADDDLEGTVTVDINLNTITDFGPVASPDGQMFHGCDFVFDVLEFQY